MAKRFLQIRNWRRFQHYTDRNPPWFKVHRELFHSLDWVSADDQSRILMFALMRLAADCDNKIPFDPDYIERVCYLNSKPDFTQLLALQFVELIDETGKVLADASELQAIARPETEKRQSTETEKKNNTPAALAVLSADDGLEIVTRIFEHYCRQLERGGGYTLTPKRIRQGLARFTDCMTLARGQPSEAALLMKRAVDNLAASKWHRDNGQYEWDLVFRSTEKLQEWLNKPQVKTNGKSSEIEDAGTEAEGLLGIWQGGDESLPTNSRPSAIGDRCAGVLKSEPHPRILDGGIRVVPRAERQPVSADTGTVDGTDTEP